MSVDKPIRNRVLWGDDKIIDEYLGKIIEPVIPKGIVLECAETTEEMLNDLRSDVHSTIAVLISDRYYADDEIGEGDKIVKQAKEKGIPHVALFSSSIGEALTKELNALGIACFSKTRESLEHNLRNWVKTCLNSLGSSPETPADKEQVVQ